MHSEEVSLIVTAHPDDETLFFSGLILSRPKARWHIACVTDGNADGHGSKRRNDFENACHALGVENTSWLGLPDVFEKRLSKEALIEKLPPLAIKEVFTHGIIGEYGHPHHQDVSYACHHYFSKKCSVWSTAYNCFPEFQVELTVEQWQKKCSILSSFYLTETMRFYNLLPVTFTEGFVQVNLPEIEALYAYLTKMGPLKTEQLKVYRSIAAYLAARHPLENRPF